MGARVVDVVDYDRSWPRRFDAERRRLQAALGPDVLRIEHIGSTAVPGMPAKPIVDVMVGTEGVSESLVDRLTRLGYEDMGEAGIADRRFLWDLARGYNLHVTELGSAYWRERLRFRDRLRAHAAEASEYALLKRRLASRYRHDPHRYTDAKTPFVRSVLRDDVPSAS